MGGGGGGGGGGGVVEKEGNTKKGESLKVRLLSHSHFVCTTVKVINKEINDWFKIFDTEYI